MTTEQVVNNIHLCQIPDYTDLTPHEEVARVLLEAKNSKRQYLSTGFQEEVEGEAPLTAPQEMVMPIF